MEYFEILLLVLMAVAGLVILALVVASGHTSRHEPRPATPDRLRDPLVPALVVDLHNSVPARSHDHDPRGLEAIPAE